MVCYRLWDWKTVGLTPMPTFSKEASHHPFNSRVFPRRARVRSVNEDPLRKWMSKRVSNVRSHVPIGSTLSVDGYHWPRIKKCPCGYRRMIETKSRSMSAAYARSTYVRSTSAWLGSFAPNGAATIKPRAERSDGTSRSAALGTAKRPLSP